MKKEIPVYKVKEVNEKQIQIWRCDIDVHPSKIRYDQLVCEIRKEDVKELGELLTEYTKS